MSMLFAVFQVAFILFFPWAVIILTKKFKLLGLLGPVFCCYAAGLLLSFLPGSIMDKGLSMSFAEIFIPIAIPLLAFSADLSSLKKLAKKTVISFVLVMISAMLVVAAAFFLLGHLVPGADKLSGMLVGVYVGGTSNLIAVGVVLGVANETIVLANTADMLAGGILFFMILSGISKIYKSFLPKFSAEQAAGGLEDNIIGKSILQDEEPKPSIVRRILTVLPAVGLAVLSLGASVGISMLITGGINVAIIMLGVTTSGILFSFVKKVRNISGAYDAGQYFIYIFSVALGLSLDFSVFSAANLMFLVYVLIVQFGVLIFHALLAFIFRIDADTALITVSAGIYGPAFIPPISNAIKNKQVLLPGIICGIFGHAVGNYLGISLALLLTLIK